MNVRHQPARQNRRWSVTPASREHRQHHRQRLFKRRCTLATPIAQNIDPAKAREELEATRKALLTGGADIIRAQRELNLTLQMPPPGYRQARAAEPEEYDESDSEVEEQESRNPLKRRGRCLPDRDARHGLDRVHLSAIVECEDLWPKVFWPTNHERRTTGAQFPIARDTRTYDGTTKPED
ncbi:hypothetical protein QYE76_033907 [Lolium multiflorum]|uniref:Uncharacterized protein n=1 Tax=Lolium multiflorum TaxID=4521 RepID=A0AAD8VKQ6_LOLMU|nr:hypothetical protein QYE76_033907 [Lolium multiflorum]